MAGLDRSVAEHLNRTAQQQPSRLLALVAATWLIAVPILAVLWLAARAFRRRQAHPLSVLVLAAVGAWRPPSRPRLPAACCWWTDAGA